MCALHPSNKRETTIPHLWRAGFVGRLEKPLSIIKVIVSPFVDASIARENV